MTPDVHDQREKRKHNKTISNRYDSLFDLSDKITYTKRKAFIYIHMVFICNGNIDIIINNNVLLIS